MLINNLKNSAVLNNYNIDFINAAICYTADQVQFSIDDRNLGSKITDAHHEKNVVVKSITLNKLFHDHRFGKYALICDIEGAESHIFSYEKDPAVIDNCQQVIIELHNTHLGNTIYSKDMLADMISKKFSMQLVFSADNIWVFEK